MNPISGWTGQVRYFAGGPRWVLAGRPQQIGQRAAPDGSVDGNARGASFAVARHQEDGIGEAGVSHRRCRNEEPAGQGRVFGRDLGDRGRWRNERGRRNRRYEGDERPSGELGRSALATFVFHVKHPRAASYTPCRRTSSPSSWSRSR